MASEDNADERTDKIPEESPPEETAAEAKPKQTLDLVILGHLGSLRLAVVLIATFVVLLSWATFVESRYNAKVSQFGIYGTWWFGVLGGLLAMNIFCAMLVRFPWKRRQTGFVITHIGLLVLLAGCLVTRRGGIDAHLEMYEGNSSSLVYEDTLHFTLDVLPEGGHGTMHGAMHGAMSKEDGKKDEDAGEKNGDGASKEEEGEKKEGEKKFDDAQFVVPFRSGPLNWSDYGTLFPQPSDDDEEEEEDKEKPKKLCWFPWQLARRDRGVIFDEGGIQLEVLDYCADSETLSIPFLKLGVDGWARSPHGMAGTEMVDLKVTVAGPHGAGLKYGVGAREVFGVSGRILFWMTGDEQEFEAFLKSKPKEPVGPAGQVVMFHDGKNYYLNLEDFRDSRRQPLGDTGLEVELLGVDPRMLGASFEVHSDEGTESMRIFADMPEFSRHDYANGVFGTFWVDASQVDPTAGEAARRGPAVPRIDILTGPDGTLAYRSWRSPEIDEIGELDLEGDKTVAFGNSADKVALRVKKFVSADKPGEVIRPRGFDKERVKRGMNVRRALLRFTVDGQSEEFWLRAQRPSMMGMHGGDRDDRTVEGDGRRVRVKLSCDEFLLEFKVFLHDFERRLDPGTSQASHYWSVVDLVKEDKEGNEQRQENVTISMNQPKDFTDPKTGRSFRLFQSHYSGPFFRGDPIYNRFVHEKHRDREKLWKSILSVNYDPGRGVKYLGCLLIVAGISVMYYMNLRSRRGRRAAPVSEYNK